MGQAKRNGTNEERIAQAIEKESKHQKKARRFFHLCRFISPHATRESLISCGRNRGFKATYEDCLPARNSRHISSLLPYIAVASLLVGESLLYKKY